MEYGSDKYYNQLNNKKVICIDFDNTVCLDEWPYIGPILPGAIEVLKKLQENGHKLILYTQRSTHYPICCKELEEYIKNHEEEKSFINNGFLKIYTADILTPAINICKDNGIIFDDINQNKTWEKLTNDNSRKIFMDYLIDDHVCGTDRLNVINSNKEICKIVDWFKIDRWCLQEGLYNETALKIDYHTYLKQINIL